MLLELWCINKKYLKRMSSRRDGKRRLLKMHQQIIFRKLNIKQLNGMTVDHINGNCLDNRRSNLRLADRYQQAINIVFIPGPSGVIGVKRNRNGKRWLAHFRWRGKYKAKTFDNLEDAGRWRAEQESMFSDYAEFRRK